MRVITLALKDLQQLFQSKQTAFFMLVMPIVFTLMFGFMFGGFEGGGGSEEDPRLPIGILNLDGSTFSLVLIQFIEDSVVVRPVMDKESTKEELQRQVNDEDLAAAVIIPAGFTNQFRELAPALITLITLDQTSTAATAAQNAVLTAYNRTYSSALTASLSKQAYLQQASFSSQTAEDAYFNAAVERALIAWETPAVSTFSTFTGTEPDDDLVITQENAFVHSSPAMMAQFAIAGLIGAAEILVSEKRTRTMQRMLTTSITRAGILAGHFLAIFIIIFLQLAVLAIFGQIFLRLEYAAHPLATLTLITIASLCNAALGLLIGALAKTSDNAVIFSLIPMFIFAGLGGAWLPMEFASPAVQRIAHFTPVAWIMDGFKNILSRDMGMEGVWLPAVALLGFTLVFFGLAVWRFRFE